MKLTALGKRKFDALAQKLVDNIDDKQAVDIEFRRTLIQNITDLFDSGGLPSLEEFSKVKEIEGLSRFYFNDMQTVIDNGLREYQEYIQDIGTTLNVLLEDLLSSNIDINKKKKIIDAKIVDIENAVINKNVAKSIHDEELLTSDFKDNNLISKASTTDISDNGALTLPISSEDQILISDASYKVEFPFSAILPLTFVPDVNGIEEAKLHNPGHYTGKLFGALEQRDDIRLESDLNRVLNNNIDRFWEIEYTTPEITTDKLRLAVILTFQNRITLNALFIDSPNEIEASYRDELGDFVHITDFDNEWFHLITTDQVRLVAFGDTPERIMYNLLAIVRNNVTTHTYNYLETIFRKRTDLYKKYFREYDVKPDNKTEGASAVSDERIIEKLKYRTNVRMNSLNAFNRTYDPSGVFETNEIRVGTSIHSVELFTTALIPGDAVEYLKYELSFDGKRFYPIRSLSETVTKFNNSYYTRIVVGENGSSPGYLYLPEDVHDTIYFRASFHTDNASMTPVLYQYNLRVKTRE